MKWALLNKKGIYYLSIKLRKITILKEIQALIVEQIINQFGNGSKDILKEFLPKLSVLELRKYQKKRTPLGSKKYQFWNCRACSLSSKVMKRSGNFKNWNFSTEWSRSCIVLALGNANSARGPLKICVLECYQVLWIHIIDTICTLSQ